MNLIAEYHAEGPRLLLGPTLEAVPEMRFELEQHTASERGLPIFFLWAEASPKHNTSGTAKTGNGTRTADELPERGRGETTTRHGNHNQESTGHADSNEFEAFEQALTADETVADASVLDEQGGRRLYRVAFAEPGFYPSFRDAAAKILALTGSADGWDVRVRFPDRDAFISFRQYYAEHGISFRLDRLYRESEATIEESAMTPIWERDLGLTEAQRDTLVAAYERGYFDEPRTITLEDLADEFAVSAQAIAGRLRRGHRNLIQNTLLADADAATWKREATTKGIE